MIDIDPVFNDLSCKPLAADKYDASERMEGFASVLLEAPGKGLGAGLRTDVAFYVLDIAENYTINDWLYDLEFSKEARDFITHLATKSPLLVNQSEDVIKEASECDVSMGGKLSDSLRAAYLIDMPTLSLAHDRWTESKLECMLTKLDEIDGCVDSCIELTNIAEHSHYEIHEDWISDRRCSIVDCPAELWEKRDTLFPHLIFHRNVEKSIKNLGGGGDLILQVTKNLFELERVAAESPQFKRENLKVTCSPTSPETLSRFGSDYYTFNDENGAEHLCSLHLYLADTDRIYFCPIEGKVFVGKVLGHLPTVKYPKLNT
ncbi:hypothetical protein HW115_08540 [Verrucomicrobiaceae bacterium N1E253]|uniref:Uncharacterized protein n=1 Tax=Oceaniferula marina TaxID=2748318 RepID=A0A851GKP1_9BACT|nr:hypothetical protein [Oceaniferula marina]NWK55657.1 hypothetical protein [Oceaniferula marina]